MIHTESSNNDNSCKQSQKTTMQPPQTPIIGATKNKLLHSLNCINQTHGKKQQRQRKQTDTEKNNATSLAHHLHH